VTLVMEIDPAIYPLEVVLRACHVFTAHWYVVPRIGPNGQIVVELTPRGPVDITRDVTGELANELLDARLRASIGEETRAIRELLLAQAFCEADLLDRTGNESDERDDPRGIA
jgi:His-Xaa-Ser system protein HxsD